MGRWRLPIRPIRGGFSPRRDEAGAALVEFALVVPVFMMLVFGLFTGGLAYSTKQSVTAAAREGSRYGATLPLAVDASCNPVSGGSANVTNWLKCVSDLTVRTASGDLNVGASGRYVCVSFVTGGTMAATVATKSRYISDTGGVEQVNTSTSDCYTLNGLTADGLGSTQPRVQVVTRRTGRMEWLVSSTSLTLNGSEVTLFEAR